MCSPVKILIFWLIHCVCGQRRNGFDTSGNRRLTDILFLKGMVMNGKSIIGWNVLILWLRVRMEGWNTSCIMLMTPGIIAYEQTLIHAGIVYCNDNIEPQYDYSLSVRDVSRLFLAATKQLYEWYFLSVRPSVCLSVTPFWLCSHHRIIMKFSGVITTDKGNVNAKDQGQRSKVKVTEVTTQLSRFRTVTLVRIHIWWWNDAYSLMLLRRGALLFFKVIRQISRSHGSKNCRIWPRLGVSGL